MKYLKLAAPGLAAAYAAGWITGTDMYKKAAVEAAADKSKETTLSAYRYGAAAAAAIAVSMLLHRSA